MIKDYDDRNFFFRRLDAKNPSVMLARFGAHAILATYGPCRNAASWNAASRNTPVAQTIEFVDLPHVLSRVFRVFGLSVLAVGFGDPVDRVDRVTVVYQRGYDQCYVYEESNDPGL